MYRVNSEDDEVIKVHRSSRNYSETDQTHLEVH